MLCIVRNLALALGLASAPVMATDRAEWNPPAQYDVPFDGKLHLMPRAPAEVSGACAHLFEWAGLDLAVSPRQRGCAVYIGKQCWIVHIDRPVYGTSPAAVIRHEVGHCNGWPSWHPEG